ncbi:ornithine carbamoyltransferase [Slackia heliotrinireducens]|uniref:ornithine carbamoyltransferase n=1 Tax=Slackia heliotrinireducens TaxID=84110 RepID=UPI00331564B8
MGVNLSGRHFLKLLDFTTEEIEYLLELSRNFKDLKRTGTPHRYLEGKNIVLLFQKTSTRTRCSFEVGAMDLGMGVTYLDPGSSQMGKKESIEDTARVLGRFYDGIEFRGFAQSDVEDLAANAGVPVWNGLTTEWHPTQMLADILTVKENFNNDIKGKTLVFMGDAKNNVARSLMVVCSKLGMNFVACGPEECMPADDVVEACRPIAEANGCTIRLTSDVAEGVAGAHVIYTDVWVSMGEPDEVWEERIRLLEPYRVTSEVMAQADPDAIFLHCLPSFHDTNTTIGAQKAEQFGITEMEVTDEVFEGPQSKVFDEAENRMHTIKAIMYATLK